VEASYGKVEGTFDEEGAKLGISVA
jgi:hypothetical protein